MNRTPTLLVMASLMLASTATAADRQPLSLTEETRLSSPRAGHQATLLEDGRVLITGGCAAAGCTQIQRSTELYSPSQRRVSNGRSMFETRVSHTASLLSDGRVIVAGGWTGASATSSTEFYDPRSGQFTRGPHMSSPRMDGTATLLASGEVLFIGGATHTNRPTRSVDRFIPATGHIVATAALQTARLHHAAVKLHDGRVLVVGGLVARRTATPSVEIFDPASGVFTVTRPLSQPRCKLAALLLKDGRVMALAGASDCEDGQKLATTEIFDPVTESWSQGPSLIDPLYKVASAAVLLDDGSVLIAGHANDVEVWHPGERSFKTLTGNAGAALAFSTATHLRDGQIFVAGGYDPNITPLAQTWRVSGMDKQLR